jgi:TolB-like protein/Tfp pilus assembly protein PilF
VTFFDELKRRKVLRVAAAYAVGGWAIAQVVALVESAFRLPDQTDAVAIMLLLIGFPVALALAWFFELTPQGIKRTLAVPAEENAAPQTGHKLDYVILGGVALVVALLAFGMFRGLSASEPSAAEGSIAVLPFVDMSAARDQEYFSDGITEELLNSLAQIDGLQVAGRTSSFAFKGDNRDLREIGEKLNVANILEGSVRKSGDQLRITVQLIKATNGFHLWSNTYDRKLTDVFAIQDEITREIVKEMSPFLPALAGKAAPRATQVNLSAYELFLQARQNAANIATDDAYKLAADQLDHSIELDPDYAPAYAWRAIVEGNRAYLNNPNFSARDALTPMRRWIDRAFALEADLPEAYHADGLYYLLQMRQSSADTLPKAIASFRKALEIRSNYSLARNDLALVLFDSGQTEQGIAELKLALEHDPALVDANINLINRLTQLGRLDEAATALGRFERISPDHRLILAGQALLAGGRGELAEERRIVDAALQAYPDDPYYMSYASFVRFKLGDVANLGAFVMRDQPINAANARVRIALVRRDKTVIATEARGEPLLRRSPSAALQTYLPSMMAIGDAKAIRTYADTELSASGATMAAVDKCQCSPAPVAWALRETRSPRQAALMQEWRSWSDAKRTVLDRAANFNAWEGDRLLLEGDEAAALVAYNRAIDFGWRSSVLDLELDPYMPDTPGFRALESRMRTLIDTERVKLGLPKL